MRVYILSNHDEYGAENARATLDVAKLGEMIKGYVAEADLSEAIKKMEAALQLGNPTVESGLKLQHGWGGLQLHIIELE